MLMQKPFRSISRVSNAAFFDVVCALFVSGLIKQIAHGKALLAPFSGMGSVTESKELSVAAGAEAELNAPQGTVSENLMGVPEGRPPPEQEVNHL